MSAVVEDLMTPVAICEADATLPEAEAMVALVPGLVLPLVDDRRFQRLVAEVDATAIARARREIGAEVCELRASDLARPPVACDVSDAPEAALAIMRAHGRLALHVVDRAGVLRGSVAFEQAYCSSDSVARDENGLAALRTALVAIVPEHLASSRTERRLHVAGDGYTSGAAQRAFAAADEPDRSDSAGDLHRDGLRDEAMVREAESGGFAGR